MLLVPWPYFLSISLYCQHLVFPAFSVLFCSWKHAGSRHSDNWKRWRENACRSSTRNDWNLMDKTLTFSPLGGIMLRHGLQYLLKFPSKVELQQSWVNWLNNASCIGFLLCLSLSYPFSPLKKFSQVISSQKYLSLTPLLRIYF